MGCSRVRASRMYVSLLANPGVLTDANVQNAEGQTPTPWSACRPSFGVEMSQLPRSFSRLSRFEHNVFPFFVRIEDIIERAGLICVIH